MIVFLSNYLSIHQLPFCLELKRLCNNDFVFISAVKMTDERVKLGYEDLDSKYDFVLKAYENKENRKKAFKLCRDADMVLEAGPWEYVKERIKLKKPIIKISERIFKKPLRKWELPLRRIKYAYRYGRNENYYLFCSGAFAAYDFSLTNTFIGRAYRWGYFPEAKRSDDVDTLINSKEHNSILWAGRFIDWKHPEYALKLAKCLKEDGYGFKLKIIGNGNMDEELRKKAADENLEDNVEFLGSMAPNEVRKYMEKSEIFIFTSDRNEGWGAVLNESMNSACAVVAGSKIGSVPFMLKDGENGYVFEDGNFEDFYKRVKLLLNDCDLRKGFSAKAYETVINHWTPEEAANRIFNFCNAVLENKDFKNLYSSGCCSYIKDILPD